ncbi:MAG: flagellar transcriptional regulator FlhD [Burkholderiales bacterium]|nr:flagellar transcriptional regulator FlhD [Burkholderiales bacterium]
MKAETIINEIREANLSYLILAQNMIRADRAEALVRLGLSDDVARIIDQLTAGQLLKIAASNMLMCRFRFDDNMVWNLLLSHTGNADNAQAAGMHAAILMAGRSVEAAV